MANFKPYDYNQDAMVVINFKEQLQPGTFEHTLHTLIDNHIDLSAFYEKYKNDGGGRSAYDPAILLKIVLFAYSRGITSSREIQWQCEHNIVFKALSCDSVPHFTGIAAFISSFPDAIESVFEQVLLVCDEQGLLGNELLAIDGCKMPSNAAKEHSGTFAELTEKRERIRSKIRSCLKEHSKLDGRKPNERERKKQLDKAADSLQKHFDKIDHFLKTAAPRMGQGKRSKEVKSNITDNESAKMLTSKGTLQGYNGVAAVDKKHQIIVEAQAYGEVQEHHTLAPMLNGVRSYYKRMGIAVDILKDQIIVTADTRTGAGRQVSITYTNGKTATDWMKRRVDSKEGKVIYGHRMSVVEPVFGNIGTNKRLNRFSLRGKEKVQGQWRLFCLAHNIEKLANCGALT